MPEQPQKPADWSDKEWREYQTWIGSLVPYSESDDTTHLVVSVAKSQEEPTEKEEENGDNVAA